MTKNLKILCGRRSDFFYITPGSFSDLSNEWKKAGLDTIFSAKKLHSYNDLPLGIEEAKEILLKYLLLDIAATH